MQSVLAHEVNEQFRRQIKNLGDLNFSAAHHWAIDAEEEAGDYIRVGSSMTRTFDRTGKKISTELRVSFRVSGILWWAKYETQMIVND
jgi:hypothetical protein